MNKVSWALIGVLVLLVGTVALAAADKDFAGTWKLNPEKSDAGGPPGGGRPGGPGGGGRGGGPGGAPRGMGGPQTLTVKLEGDHLHFTEEDGRGSFEADLTIGGGSAEISTPRGPITAEASWDGDVLVVVRDQTRESQRGTMQIHQVQRWSLSDDGASLTQDISIDSGQRTFQRKLVFDKQ